MADQRKVATSLDVQVYEELKALAAKIERLLEKERIRSGDSVSWPTESSPSAFPNRKPQ